MMWRPEPAATEQINWLRFSGYAVMVAVGYVAAVGILAGVIANPWFHRVVDVDVWNVLALILPATLFGLLAGTYLVPWPRTCRIGGRAGSGGALSFLAVSCPVCNKLVVFAIGVSGALDYFRPLQPLLGAASVFLLGIALWARLRPQP